jgi:hypothetical protein
MNWATANGSWTRFRQLPDLVEGDFHRSGRQDGGYYHDHMAVVSEDVLDAFQKAQADGKPYVLFSHGWSTSVGWKQPTSRSVIRKLMRSPEATPYIDRARCIQPESVFVAAIRSATANTGPAKEPESPQGQGALRVTVTIEDRPPITYRPLVNLQDGTASDCRGADAGPWPLWAARPPGASG